MQVKRLLKGRLSEHTLDANRSQRLRSAVSRQSKKSHAETGAPQPTSEGVGRMIRAWSQNDFCPIKKCDQKMRVAFEKIHFTAELRHNRLADRAGQSGGGRLPVARRARESLRRRVLARRRPFLGFQEEWMSF